MLNSTNGGYSLSDIAAATGGNGMFGGSDGGAWWIIILFLFCFMGWGGNGFGGYNNAGATDAAAAVTYALDTNSIKDSIVAGTASLASDIASSSMNSLSNFYSLSTQMNNLASQQASNTCDVRRDLAAMNADINYNLASQSCDTRQTITTGVRDIIDTDNANTRAILDFLTQSKIDELTAENTQLRFAASQAEQNNYLVSTLRPTAMPAYLTNGPSGAPLAVNYGLNGGYGMGCGYGGGFSF